MFAPSSCDSNTFNVKLNEEEMSDLGVLLFLTHAPCSSLQISALGSDQLQPLSADSSALLSKVTALKTTYTCLVFWLLKVTVFEVLDCTSDF